MKDPRIAVVELTCTDQFEQDWVRRVAERTDPTQNPCIYQGNDGIKRVTVV